MTEKSEQGLSRRTFLKGVGSSTLALSLGSLWHSGVMAQGEDTLTIGIHQDASTLDPGNHRERVTETILRPMFDGLTTRTPEMEVVPQLAESWKRVGPTVWEYKLRKGVTFHDGESFNAEHAKFTIDREIGEVKIGGKTSPRKGLLGATVGCEIVDNYTIRIVLDSPWPVLNAFLPWHEIVPKGYIKDVGDDYFAEHPVGTGPFKFVEREPGALTVMEGYDNYYGGAPKLKRLIFKVIPETSSRIAALRAGEVDIITKVPVDLRGEIQGDPNTALVACDGTRSYFLGLNCVKPPFYDLRVRQAFNYAIDMEKIGQYVFGGAATPIPSILSKNAFGYLDLDTYGHDPAKAKKLLAEAGYPNGFEVTVDTEDFVKDAAQAYAQMLREIGIDAKVQVWEWGVLKPKLLNHERDIWLSDWGNGSMQPDGIMKPKLITDGRGNYTGYSNQSFDNLWDAIKKGPKLRQAGFEEMQRIIYREAPMVYGYTMREFYGAGKSVQNFKPSPDSRLYISAFGSLTEDVYKA